MLKDLEKQIKKTTEELQFALKHLEYSYSKVKKLGLPALEDMESLETWESFTFRFSRVSDLFCKKLLRTLVLQGDPSFRGSLMDLLNQSEKQEFISNSNRWWNIRALRNKEAHEYTRSSMIPFFEAILSETDFLISEVKSLLKSS